MVLKGLDDMPHDGDVMVYKQDTTLEEAREPQGRVQSLSGACPACGGPCGWVSLKTAIKCSMCEMAGAPGVFH